MSSFNVTSFPALSGGLPTGPDKTPSIVFAIACAVLLLPALWRTYTYRRPGKLLLTFVRLCLFIAVRIATFILRAMEGASASIPANPVPSIGEFIAEQILLGIGFIVLVDLIVELLKSHIWRTDLPQQRDETPFAQNGPNGASNGLQRIVRLMHVALITAIVLGITAGTRYQAAMTDPSQASTVKTLRIASSGITLIVSALCAAVSLLLLLQYPHLGSSRTLYLLATSLIMTVVPAYRLSTSLSTPSESGLVSSQTRLEFYILQALMEWLVAFLLVLVDARVWFFAGGEEAQKMLRAGGGAGRRGSASKEGLTGPGGGGGEQYPMDVPLAPRAPMHGEYKGQYGGQGQGQYGGQYAPNYA